MIKKMKFIQIISLFMLFLMIFIILNPINVSTPTTVTNNWISECLDDYKPLQTLIKDCSFNIWIFHRINTHHIWCYKIS